MCLERKVTRNKTNTTKVERITFSGAWGRIVLFHTPNKRTSGGLCLQQKQPETHSDLASEKRKWETCYSFRLSWGSTRGQRGRFRRRFCCHLSGPNLTAKNSSSLWKNPNSKRRYTFVFTPRFNLTVPFYDTFCLLTYDSTFFSWI